MIGSKNVIQKVTNVSWMAVNNWKSSLNVEWFHKLGINIVFYLTLICMAIIKFNIILFIKRAGKLQLVAITIKFELTYQQVLG